MLERTVRVLRQHEKLEVPDKSTVIKFRPRARADAHVRSSSDGSIIGSREAANDNERLNVVDDLPRPLPVMQGEGDLVRKLLGDQFPQILKGDEL